MPPKRASGAKKKPKESKDTVVRIDPNKHAAELKAIEESHRQYELELAAEAEQFIDEEEEMGEEGDMEEVLSEYENPDDWGRIDLSFPETKEEFKDSPLCYPPSYYTLSPKERLLLLYAENFRQQFVTNYPKRRPLVLALPNECHVQKFVCTTIRPTAFLHIPLIGSLEGCASFVADFIIYEPLEDIMNFPTRLLSPSTLLRRRRGNCFEMATLLCSMLIGAGFPAMVVSGVARNEVVVNDQRQVPYPYEIAETKVEETATEKEKTGQKYKLRPMPDLKSHLEEQLAEIRRQKEEEKRLQKEEAERKEAEALELVAVDRYHYRRTHAWVVVVDNAPWSIKQKKTYVNEDGITVPEPPKARFIEPSTGFICETGCKQYILLDSVWNDHNYYVNIQKYDRISDLRWDLCNTSDWEHLLAGEPPEMRKYVAYSHESLIKERPIPEEKHLDTIRSWVMKLHIGVKDFEERFPKLQKKVEYYRAIHERFSPYSQRDGKEMQLTLYSDDEYKQPTMRWRHYKNRADLLLQMKLTYENYVTEEVFAKGRNDSLRFMSYCADPKEPRTLQFNSMARIDSLSQVTMYPDCLVLNFEKRSDRCYHQEFDFKAKDQSLKKIMEKYHRNTTEDVPANKDIAERFFYLLNNKIFIRFHYAHGTLTASTIDFTKPPKPDYGQEIVFSPELAHVYKAKTGEASPTQLELYKLLLEQLQQEEKMKKQFERISDEMNEILLQRKHEMANPVLKFNIFDPMRNGAARAIRTKRFEEEEAYKRKVSENPPDFLAPYLVAFKNKVLTTDESWATYNACLDNLRTRFIALLNELQRQYEDLSSEAKALKRFLNKFENQFNNYDYIRLVQEAKDIELNKRMVQQRLTLTHEEAQKKYERVKQSLLSDPRLNLKQNSL